MTTSQHLLSLADRVEGLSGPDRRILDRLDRSGECWLWTGKLDVRGRGRVWHNGRLKLHHRAVWNILVGPIPDGALLCHHCDNPRCANPSHIYVGDGKTNVRDMFVRGRHWTQEQPDRARRLGARLGVRNNWAKGERNPKAKLTPHQVAEISLSKAGTRVLARHYGVAMTTIQRIRSGKAWAGALRAIAGGGK